MFVGTLFIRLHIRDAHSLKEKRSIMRKSIDRIISNFNASAAEVGSNDIWHTGEIGVAMIGNNSAFLESKLQKVINMLEDMYLAEIIEKNIEIYSTD